MQLPVSMKQPKAAAAQGCVSPPLWVCTCSCMSTHECTLVHTHTPWSSQAWSHKGLVIVASNPAPKCLQGPLLPTSASKPQEPAIFGPRFPTPPISSQRALRKPSELPTRPLVSGNVAFQVAASPQSPSQRHWKWTLDPTGSGASNAPAVLWVGRGEA